MNFYDGLRRAQLIHKEMPGMAYLLLQRGHSVGDAQAHSVSANCSLPISGDRLAFLEQPKVIPNLWAMVS